LLILIVHGLYTHTDRAYSFTQRLLYKETKDNVIIIIGIIVGIIIIGIRPSQEIMAAP
jgi:hypothetical protein